MAVQLKKALKELQTVLEMIPIDQEHSFKLQAINGGDLTCYGMLRNKHLQMDQVQMSANVESRWMFQNKDIHFMIFYGSVDLHFRLNENIHIKHLSTSQSLRIPTGVPFMLKTYEVGGSILLISIVGKNNGKFDGK